MVKYENSLCDQIDKENVILVPTSSLFPILGTYLIVLTPSILDTEEGRKFSSISIASPFSSLTKSMVLSEEDNKCINK